MAESSDRVRDLSCWAGPVEIVRQRGGITNENFSVTCGSERYFVRLGDDIPVHGVMRFNELAASRAAAAAGLSPEVLFWEEGVLVLRFIEGRTLTDEDVRQRAYLSQIVQLVCRCHTEMPREFRGPVLMFWVFHVLRGYTASLLEGGSRMADQLERLQQIVGKLERDVGKIQLAFCHNDLLAANWIDDGERLWLVDWDYAGLNSPLFDLANLATNNGFSDEQEKWLLETYYGHPGDDQLLRGYSAMRCASLLRESMWSMVSEIHSRIDFDYVGYSNENLEKFERAWEAHQGQFGS
jgi:thiamine kinase-like enzyme